MKNLNKTPLIAAISTAIAASFAAGAVNAAANPFAMSEMSQGYMQVAGVVPAEKSASGIVPVEKTAGDAAKKTEGACGEAKCGAMMKEDGKMKEGMEKTCGAMMKGKEGACGAMGDAKTGDKAAGAMGGMKDGAEMACGAGMKDGTMDMKSKDMEAACGAKMTPAK